MMYKASCSIKEVPYYFSGSSIKFQGHIGWKIDDSVNPIWVRSLGRSHLSNPSDLPCSNNSKWKVIHYEQAHDVFFDLRLNKRLSKQSWGWWFETLSRPLWRHCNDVYTVNKWPQLMHLRAVAMLRLYVCTMQYILHDWDTYQRAKCFTVKWRRIRCEVLMHIGK